MSQGFHPEKSRVSSNALAVFIRSPITGDLNEVPGVGASTIKIFNEYEITTTYQLIAKYLSLKDEGVESVEHADRFYLWLLSIKTPGGFRAGIVHSIAEKCNVIFPGIYDASVYNEEAAE